MFILTFVYLLMQKFMRKRSYLSKETNFSKIIPKFEKSENGPIKIWKILLTKQILYLKIGILMLIPIRTTNPH